VINASIKTRVANSRYRSRRLVKQAAPHSIPDERDRLPDDPGVIANGVDVIPAVPMVVEVVGLVRVR
jgi:hypothetical protein